MMFTFQVSEQNKPSNMKPSAVQDKELSAERVFLIFTTVGLVRAPLGGVAMGFTAVVDGLAAFRRLNAFVSQRRPACYENRLRASVRVDRVAR